MGCRQQQPRHHSPLPHPCRLPGRQAPAGAAGCSRRACRGGSGRGRGGGAPRQAACGRPCSQSWPAEQRRGRGCHVSSAEPLLWRRVRYGNPARPLPVCSPAFPHASF
jgi:hypothetical protein